MVDKLEAIARIISPSAMKSIETIREEWTTWTAARDFGDGPRKVDRLKFTEGVVQDEWGKLQPKRLRALKKASEILALFATPANGEQVERHDKVTVGATPTEDARERVKVLEEALESARLAFVAIAENDDGVNGRYAAKHATLVTTALGNKETDRHG